MTSNPQRFYVRSPDGRMITGWTAGKSDPARDLIEAIVEVLERAQGALYP